MLESKWQRRLLPSCSLQSGGVWCHPLGWLELQGSGFPKRPARWCSRVVFSLWPWQTSKCGQRQYFCDGLHLLPLFAFSVVFPSTALVIWVKP